MKIFNTHHKPKRENPGDAGLDLHVVGDHTLKRFQPMKIHTGVYTAIPGGHVGLCKERSSAHLSYIMALAGTIDSGYRGEIRLVLMYYGPDESITIHDGERYVQMIVTPCHSVDEYVKSLEELGETERGKSGFGSTGR